MTFYFFRTSSVKPRDKAMNPLPSRRPFFIELGLSCNNGSSKKVLAKSIQRRSGFAVTVVGSNSHSHDSLVGWKLVHDGSIIHCQGNAPYCSIFELVSPILKGEDGLLAISKILHALRNSTAAKVSLNNNDVSLFHVHVSAKGISLESLKKVCQNFIKYEDAMDAFFPACRRTGSEESNLYFRSCKKAILNPDGTRAITNGQRHQAIEACTSIYDLVVLMNPAGRCYKLNLRNLVTRRQPTLEFRQHHGTTNADKVQAWVRFCVHFVHNSSGSPDPIKPLKNLRTPRDQFILLFFQVLPGDPVLQAYFEGRMDLFARLTGLRHVSSLRISNDDGRHGHDLPHNYTTVTDSLSAAAAIQQRESYCPG